MPQIVTELGHFYVYKKNPRKIRVIRAIRVPIKQHRVSTLHVRRAFAKLRLNFRGS